MTNQRAAWHPILIAVLVSTITVGTFWIGISGPLIFDDHLLQNPNLHLTEWSWPAIERALSAFGTGFHSRALATLSFATNHYFSGLDPWGYKLTGLLIHGANAVLVWIFLSRLIRLANLSGDARTTTIAAALGALLWAVHPLQVSSALYVVQRMETMATGFILLALIAYLQMRAQQLAGERWWPAATGVVLAMLAGLLCKETAALTPLFALALELTVLGFRTRHAPVSVALRIGYSMLVTFGITYFLLKVLPEQLAPEAYAIRDFSLGERLLTQFRVLPLYLQQIGVPLPDTMPFYYDNYPHSTGWLSPPSTLQGALLLAALGLLGLLQRHRRPMLSLAVLWFFVAHSITSNVIPLELAFEHRNYLAMLSLPLALLAALPWARQRIDGPKLIALAVMLVLSIGFLGHLRAMVWGSPIGLRNHHVMLNPTSERALTDLGNTLFANGKARQDGQMMQNGLDVLVHAADQIETSPFPEFQIILRMAELNNSAPRTVWENLRKKLAIAGQASAGHMVMAGLAHGFNGGIALEPREIRETCKTAIDRPFMTAHAYALCGDIVLRTAQDEKDLGYQLFRAAISINNSTSDYQYSEQIISTVMELGHAEIANQLREEAEAPPPQRTGHTNQ